MKRRAEKKPSVKDDDLKSFIKKAWRFIWHDDSLASWIVNIVLAYVIIRFLIYPGLGLLLGTNLPIVAVVSNSMEHRTSLSCIETDLFGNCVNNSYDICGKILPEKQSVAFDEFWELCGDHYMGRNITKADFEKYPFRNGFNRGDIMLLIGKKPDKIKLGDVIVFQSGKPYPIIHRVVEKDNKGMWIFQTLGDHNRAQIRDLELDETRILEKQLLGKAVIRIPFLGYIKIWFVDLLRFAGINIAN
jgi:signal peptidase